MKKLASLETIQNIHRALRMGYVSMLLKYWRSNRETVETLGYGRIARLVAHCVIALETANKRLDCDLRVELELRQAGNAIAELDRDERVSPSLVNTLDEEFGRTHVRLDPVLRTFTDYRDLVVA